MAPKFCFVALSYAFKSFYCSEERNVECVPAFYCVLEIIVKHFSSAYFKTRMFIVVFVYFLLYFKSETIKPSLNCFKF